MKLFQYETHCHTSETSRCGILSATEVVDGLKAHGYAGTFITDHFYAPFFNKPGVKRLSWEKKVDKYLKGYRAAKKRGDEIGLKVFLGMEVMTDHSPYEFLVYGPDEAYIYENGPFYQLDVCEFYQLMKKSGFLVFQAHPYRNGLAPVSPKCYDGIEMLNSQLNNDSKNKRALKFAFENDVYTIAGSDIHRDVDIGRSGLMLPESINTTKEFIDYYNEVKTPEMIVTYGS